MGTVLQLSQDILEFCYHSTVHVASIELTQGDVFVCPLISKNKLRTLLILSNPSPDPSITNQSIQATNPLHHPCYSQLGSGKTTVLQEVLCDILGHVFSVREMDI
jgi:hypothetical protein